jgi:hypothetical protein
VLLKDSSRGFLELHRRFTAAGPSRSFTGVPCCLTSFNARESPYALEHDTPILARVNPQKTDPLAPKFVSAPLRESLDALAFFSKIPVF